MIEYVDILNSIKKCEGSLVTILMDYNNCNDDFLTSIYQELNIDYKIEYDRFDIKNINEKTVVFINVKNIPRAPNSIGIRSKIFRNLLGNENVILIAVNKINVAMTPSSLYGTEEIYQSNIVFLLKNQKLTIVKSRYSILQNTNSLDISNMTKLVRKIKLNRINKK